MKKQRLVLNALMITFFFASCMSSVEKSYVFNDGPWITYHDKVNKYIISWTTGTSRDSTVCWGQSKTDLKNKFVSKKTRNHRLELENLKPGKYYYSIQEKLTLYPKGHVFSFNVGYPKKTKIAVLGDVQVRNIQSGKMASIIANAVKREKPDVAIQMGDLVEVPWFNTSWHEAMKVLNVFSGEIPFYPTVGNHEQINGDFVNYKTVFSNDYAKEKAAYYSFTINNAFFISIDYCDAGYKKVSKEQIKWIESELKDAKERDMKWIFILLHGNLLDTHPMKQEFKVQRWLIPLADKYEIDGILTGHTHGYQCWEYAYGHDNLLYNKDDKPTGKKIPYWCVASSGSCLFVNYGLLSLSLTDTIEMYNSKTGKMEKIEVSRPKWNPKNFIDHRDNIYFGQPFLFAGKHFYHDPDIENYSNQNEHFGFVYGEQTSHYMLIEIEGDTCEVSVHYADGSIISGPNNDKPQQWTFTK